MPTKDEEAYGTGQKKVEVTGFKTPDASRPVQKETTPLPLRIPRKSTRTRQATKRSRRLGVGD